MSPPDNANSPLAAPVSDVWGVGEERAKLLARLNINTVEDLLLHKPRRYEDRRKFLPIRELKLKEAATVRGTIVAAGVKRFRKGARAMFECVFDDGTAHLHCRWWQAQPWMEDWYAVGREFLIFGKPDSLKPRNMDHPETELVEPGEDEFIHVNRIVPIHPLTDGLTARVVRMLVWRALEKFENEIAEPAIDLHSKRPLTPSLSPAGGEGARRAGEGAGSANSAVVLSGDRIALARRLSFSSVSTSGAACGGCRAGRKYDCSRSDFGGASA